MRQRGRRISPPAKRWLLSRHLLKEISAALPRREHHPVRSIRRDIDTHLSLPTGVDVAPSRRDPFVSPSGVVFASTTVPPVTPSPRSRAQRRHRHSSHRSRPRRSSPAPAASNSASDISPASPRRSPSRSSAPALYSVFTCAAIASAESRFIPGASCAIAPAAITTTATRKTTPRRILTLRQSILIATTFIPRQRSPDQSSSRCMKSDLEPQCQSQHTVALAQPHLSI